MGDFNITIEKIYDAKRKSIFNASSRTKLEKEYINFIKVREKLYKDLDDIRERMLELK